MCVKGNRQNPFWFAPFHSKTLSPHEIWICLESYLSFVREIWRRSLSEYKKMNTCQFLNLSQIIQRKTFASAYNGGWNKQTFIHRYGYVCSTCDFGSGTLPTRMSRAVSMRRLVSESSISQLNTTKTTKKC